jgi:RNA recognition motif-containing protein
MSKKLYISSLPFSVKTDDELKSIVSAMGAVTSAKIITDTKTGKGKGFGFVEMETEEAAEQAIIQLNNTIYNGRTILVSEARSEINNPKDIEADKENEESE